MNIDQMRAVNAILLHDGESSNAELVYYFVHELDVTPIEAWRAYIDARQYLNLPPIQGWVRTHEILGLFRSFRNNVRQFLSWLADPVTPRTFDCNTIRRG